jgi:F420-non-reducing hydrogenase large subunit
MQILVRNPEKKKRWFDLTTLTFPLSRIEGHAQVVIETQGGEVVSTHFEAMELRGFEYWVQGTPAEQMPVIVPRICGVCSTAHHIAAVEALEDAYDVTPPPLAIKIRELMLIGQLIQNQATSMFVFTLPDRMGLSSIFDVSDEERSEKVRGEIAGRALQVRKAGTDLISLAGGQFIHPIKAVVGGVTSGIRADEAEKMHTQIEEVLPLASELFDTYWDMSIAMSDRIGNWGDDTPTYYIAALGDREHNFYSDEIRVMSPEGEMCDSFHPWEYRDYLTYEKTDYSYAGSTSYKGNMIRANSLARVNMGEKAGTTHTDHYLQRFRDAFGKPAHAILLYDLARGVELVYGLERALTILEEPLDYEDTDVPYKPKDGHGYGLVEAPRGPLIHHYQIENNLVSRAEFVIPTVHNVLAIEHALRVAAERYIDSDRVDMELENAVGRVVRAFDPCIACATH